MNTRDYELVDEARRNAAVSGAGALPFDDSQDDQSDRSMPNPDPTTSVPGGLSRPVIKVYEAGDEPLSVNFPLPGESLVVGRSRTCGLILADLDVSAEHVRFFWDAPRPMVEELGSTNGTLLIRGENLVEEPIEPGFSVEVRHKDRLELCDGVSIEFFDYMAEIAPKPRGRRRLRPPVSPREGEPASEPSAKPEAGVILRMWRAVPAACSTVLRGGAITQRLRSLPTLFKVLILLAVIAAGAAMLWFGVIV